jgi:nucleoside transporter
MNSVRVKLCIMMFLQFFVWGAFFVPMGTYLGTIFAKYQETNQLNGIIGGAYATQTWAALFAPLIVGFAADRLFNKEKLNGVLHLIGGGLLWWISTIKDSPDQFFWAMLAFFICYMPTLALVNAITFQNVESIENDFPKVRLWGTIGWIVSGLVVAQSLFGLVPLPVLPWVADASKTAVPLQLSAIVSIIYGLFSFTLPASPPQGRDEPFSIVKALGLDAIRLFANPSYLVFAVCSFLICIPLAFYDSGPSQRNHLHGSRPLLPATPWCQENAAGRHARLGSALRDFRADALQCRHVADRDHSARHLL